MKGIPMTNDAVFTLDTVVRRIVEFRGQRVMLDSDLAVLYGVETGALVRATKRNPGRFPKNFMFQLSTDEWETLRCQIGASKFDSASLRVMKATTPAPFASVN
jgi:hypothetical protein